MRKFIGCIMILLFAMIACETGTEITQNNEIPKGFGFNNPLNYRDYPNLYGGTGTIKYAELFGPDDYKTKHHFLRVGVIPPGCSIGEYHAVDSDELFIIISGIVFATVNSHTARIVSGSMVPCRMGETIGLYNPTDKDVSFAWFATVDQKGKYNPVAVGNDLSKKMLEEPCTFIWMPLDYGNFRMDIQSAHGGNGTIYDTFGRLGMDFFKTKWGAFYLVLPPGTSIGYHKHNIHEEMYFVVSGNARGTVDDITLDMKLGDCTLCPLDSSHGIYNNGTENLGIICTLLSSLPSGELDAEDLGDDLTNR